MSKLAEIHADIQKYADAGLVALEAKNKMREILALCNSASAELRSIKRESHKIDQYDLHYRADWVLTRVEYAIELLEQ